MSERWDVSSWDSHIGERAKQFQGCFESKIAADRFIVSASGHTGQKVPSRTVRTSRTQPQQGSNRMIELGASMASQNQQCKT